MLRVKKINAPNVTWRKKTKTMKRSSELVKLTGTMTLVLLKLRKKVIKTMSTVSFSCLLLNFEWIQNNISLDNIVVVS